MHLTRTGAGRLTALLFAAEALLMLLPGCGHDKQAAGTAPEIRDVSLPSETTADAAPARPIYGPRSDKEVELIYKGAGSAGPVPTYNPKSVIPSWSATDRGVVGEEAWNVPITREWRHIVIHHSASPTGNAAIFNQAHIQRGWEGLGYDFVIGNGSGSADGQIEVGYRWKQQLTGAHAGNVEYNQAGIGICLVGNFDNSYPTQAQMDSLQRLVRFLQVKTGIPTCEIIGHRNVPNRSTDCPGKHFDLEAFKASLGGGAIGVPIRIVRSAPAARTSQQVAHASNNAASLP